MADEELLMDDLEVVDTTSPEAPDGEQENAADEESLLDLMYGDMEVVDQVTADQIQEEDVQENEYFQEDELGEEFIEINEDMVEVDDINSKQESGLEAHVDTAPCNVDGGDEEEAKDKAASSSGNDVSIPIEVTVSEVQDAEKPVEETEFQQVDKTDSTADVNTADTSEDIAEESDVLQVEDPQNDLDADLLTSQKEQESISVSADQEGEKGLDNSEMELAGGDKKLSLELESNAEKSATSQENNTVTSANKTASCNDKEAKKEDANKSQSDTKSSKPSESKSNEKTESVSRNLWVSGLPSTTKAADLKTLFSKYGKVMVTKVLASSKISGAKCYGFVTMSTSKEASDSVQHLNGTKIQGKYVIQVTKKEPKKNTAKKSDEKTADKKTESAEKKDQDRNKRKITERRSYRPRSTNDSTQRDSGDRNRSHGNTHRDSRMSRVSSSSRPRSSHHTSIRSSHQSRSSYSSKYRRSSGTGSSKDHRPSSSHDKSHKSPVKKESEKKASSSKPEKKEKPEASSSSEKTGEAEITGEPSKDRSDVDGKEAEEKTEAKTGDGAEKKSGDEKASSESKSSEKGIVPFDQMKEEKIKEWEKMKKRKSLQEDLKRKEIYQEKKRQKDIHIRQRMESLKLSREREKLRRERQRLERERLAAQRREFLRLEQLERDKQDRERTERLRLERLRLEEERDRRALKRMFERSIEDEWLDNKRSLMSDSFQRDRYRDIDSRDLRPTRYDDARLDRDAYDNRRIERYNRKDLGRSDIRDREAARSSLRDDRNEDRFDRFSDRNRDAVRGRDGDAGRYRDSDRGRDVDRRPQRNTFDNRGERKIDRGVVPASRNIAHQSSHWGSGSQSASGLSSNMGASAYMTSVQQPGIMMGGQRIMTGQHAAVPMNTHIGMNHNIRRY